ncbi:MAG TPA: hypothetical protein VNF45_00945 [Candidatus Binataceae bacterium]|nr:hypothetical protein [Candidatus Binataceae bacterium]
MLAILATLAVAGSLPVWMAVGSITMLIGGTVDDIVALRPSRKLAVEIGVVLLVLALGPVPALTPWPNVNVMIAAVWMIAVINAFNLVDGLDGLAAGVGILAAIAIALTGLIAGNRMLALEAAVVAGALGGFLLYNFYPAKIFMGDCGALTVGLILAVLSLRAGALEPNSCLSRIIFPIAVMLLPLTDTAIVTISRAATEIPISRRGGDHSHHRLLLMGLTVPRAVGVCWSFSAVGVVAAVALGTLSHAYVLCALPFVAAAVAVVALFMVNLTFELKLPEKQFAFERAEGIARHILNFGYKLRMAEAVLDLTLIPAAFVGAYLLRLDFRMNDGLIESMAGTLPFIILATYTAFLGAGIYRGIWRYASFPDVMRFANGSLFAGILIVILAQFRHLELSGSIVVLYVILLFNLLVATRMSFRVFRRAIAALAMSRGSVLIVGAGQTGEAAARFIASGADGRLRPVGFADDDAFKEGKIVYGLHVLGSLGDLERIHSETRFQQILVAQEGIDAARMSRVFEFARAHGMLVRRFSISLSDLESVALADPPIETGSTNVPARQAV